METLDPAASYWHTEGAHPITTEAAIQSAAVFPSADICRHPHNKDANEEPGGWFMNPFSGLKDLNCALTKKKKVS